MAETSEATKVPSELVMSEKWDKLLERVLINARPTVSATPFESRASPEDALV